MEDSYQFSRDNKMSYSKTTLNKYQMVCKGWWCCIIYFITLFKRNDKSHIFCGIFYTCIRRIKQCDVCFILISVSGVTPIWLDYQTASSSTHDIILLLLLWGYVIQQAAVSPKIIVATRFATHWTGNWIFFKNTSRYTIIFKSML